jgi:hypothetical protein
VNAEFNWWLLIVGIGAGVAVTWLVLSDLGRREEELTDQERAAEAGVLADELARQGRPTSIETVERVLTLHRAYVAGGLRPPEAEPDDGPGRSDGRDEPPASWTEVEQDPGRFDPASGQSSASRIGSPLPAPPTVSSETPNRAPGSSAETVSDQPDQ